MSATVATDRLLTPRELSERLQVPLGTMWQWSKRRVGPEPVKIGRHLRYRPADVASWIESQRKGRWAGSGADDDQSQDGAV